jgi:RNA polymerase sigma-70 factor (ECF subfamily)
MTLLAAAARDGDRAALSVFLRDCQADIWKLHCLLVDRESADDLTQETFERMLGALPRFRGDCPARAWALSIARKTAADEIRRRQRRRRMLGRLRPSADAADHASSAGTAELLAALGEARRVPFILTQYLGLSYVETAAVCGCEVGTVRSRVARAREALVAMLAAAEVDSSATAPDEPEISRSKTCPSSQTRSGPG